MAKCIQSYKVLRHFSVILALFWLAGCEQFTPRLMQSLGQAVTTSLISTNGVVLAMGQSNMAGKTPGKNPAVGFTQATNIPTINCAVGGTNIDAWQINGPLDSDCWNDVIKSKKQVVAILWYQGESDAWLNTTTWDSQFIHLVKMWRDRYGNVPVIYAQLATEDTPPNPRGTWELIKQQQASLYLTDSAMVRTDDLPRQDDVHLTGDACMEVGKRMARAFISLER